MRKPTIWFLNRSDTNRAVQALKMARGWKFWIKKVDELTIGVAKAKALISETADLCLWFRYAETRFSHGMA